MHDNLTTKQVEFIQDLLHKQWSLQYYKYAVWLMPLLMASIELSLHIFGSGDRSMVFSIASVLGFAYFYNHLRKGSRHQILSTVRKSLMTIENGQAVSIYKDRYPGVFQYLCTQLNSEFGMNMKS